MAFATKHQVGIHDRRCCLQALPAAITKDVRSLLNIVDERMDDLNHQHGPHRHDDESKQEAPNQSFQACCQHGHLLKAISAQCHVW